MDTSGERQVGRRRQAVQVGLVLRLVPLLTFRGPAGATAAAADNAVAESEQIECVCETMHCNCVKPCACGEAFSEGTAVHIGGSGECWCSKLECSCQKQCDCAPSIHLLPPPPPPPSPPVPTTPSPPPPSPPSPPPFDACGCAKSLAGLRGTGGRSGGRGEGVGSWPPVAPFVATGRPGCAKHVGDGIDYCYVLEPDACSCAKMVDSVAFSGATWLLCDSYTGQYSCAGGPASRDGDQGKIVIDGKTPLAAAAGAAVAASNAIWSK